MLTLHRTYRDSNYHIHVVKPEGVEKGVQEMLVNGQKVSGNLIRPIEGTKEYNVEIVMG